MNKTSLPRALKRALNHAYVLAGSQAELARMLGIRPPTICQWMNGSRRVPAVRCLEIERLTGGLVRCEDLRPDIDWAILRGGGPAPQSGAARSGGRK